LIPFASIVSVQDFLLFVFFSTLIIRNVSLAANQHITMISEESCNTEYCSGAKILPLLSGIDCIFTFIKIETHILNGYNLKQW